ncbi:MAG: acyl-CoA dehydrogenase family protein [Verrucomicrobia bacterium]|nr:acyl-CoA dehydrogenase family protein [Verrucomicrobiota bacterium]
MPKSNRLTEERASHPLPIDQLKTIFLGGEEKAKLYREALKILRNHPDLLDTSTDYRVYDMSRSELRKRTFEKICKFKNLAKEIKNPKLLEAILDLAGISDANFGIRFGVSTHLFGAAIQGQGTKEQIDEYIPKLNNLDFHGCFCMTELGTGSYLQSLQTTATYIKETDEFIIHSPTLTATKWWIGSAAQTATHTVVYAKLILNGEDLGTHNFLVRLRDDNFDPCPGITIGDAGPKRGCDGIDNGWVRFNQVRIPRTNMLMKWAQVSAEGKYTKSEFPQLAYGAVIGTRVLIAKNVTYFMKMAITIASRFSIVRDQYSMKGKCLMDYTTQQERILGALCTAYALDFACDRLFVQLETVEEELKKRETRNLKDLHNQAAAMKGFGTLAVGKAINDCILCMGGHSYSKFSGMPRILNDFAPNIPWEGDAILMVQQTAAYLMKSVAGLFQGTPLQGDSIQYLQKLGTVSDIKCSADPSKPLSLKEMEEAAEWLALNIIKNSALKLQTQIGETGDQNEGWNRCQLDLIHAAKAHLMFSIISIFRDKLENELPKELQPVLTHVAELFALLHLQEFLNILYEDGYFPITRGNLLREQILSLYQSLRPYISSLVDAWEIPDEFLKSPLGRFDGDIYENYFQAVNSLPQEIKPPYWNKRK